MRCCRTNHLKKAPSIRKHHLLEKLVAILCTIYLTSNLVTAECSTEQVLYRARALNTKIRQLLQTMSTDVVENATGINGMDEVHAGFDSLKNRTLTRDQMMRFHFRSICIFRGALLNMATEGNVSGEFQTKLGQAFSLVNALRNSIRWCFREDVSNDCNVSYDDPCDATCVRQKNLHVTRLMLRYVLALINRLDEMTT